MNEDEAAKTMAEGFNMFANQCRIMAMLPIEEWLAALEKAETLGPLVDPTLYRAYIHAERTTVLKEMLRAALPLKQAVMKAQPAIKREIERERKAN